jgi:hypothetical protein
VEKALLLPLEPPKALSSTRGQEGPQPGLPKHHRDAVAGAANQNDLPQRLVASFRWSGTPLGQRTTLLPRERISLQPAHRQPKGSSGEEAS